MHAGYANSKTPAHLRGKWRTPPELHAALDSEFHFTADVAAEPHTALHPQFITAEDNALERLWHDFGGTVWCNPPYDDIAPWIDAAAICCDKGTGCVMLVPASTGVEWWRKALDSVSEIRFIVGGRIKFLHPETGVPVNGNMGGSAFLIWNCNDFPEQARISWHNRDEIIAAGLTELSRREKLE